MMLRPATAADLPAVTALWSDPAHAMQLPPPEDGEPEALCDAGLLWLWEDAGQLAGFVALTVWSASDGTWGITHFATARRGQGDGRRFLRALLVELFGNRGIHRLSVDSAPDNAPALRLWQRAGFRHEGRLRQCWKRPNGARTDSLLFGLLAPERNPAALD